MKLLTKELERKIPDVDTACKKSDPICWAKFFTPWSHWTWYVLGCDKDTKLCFGYVEGDYNEIGSFDLNELEEIRGPFGMRIERDKFFDPVPLSEVRKTKGE